MKKSNEHHKQIGLNKPETDDCERSNPWGEKEPPKGGKGLWTLEADLEMVKLENWVSQNCFASRLGAK